ncbi:aspartate aminotransferase family protein [Neobacillus sp. DY30]|uniref:aspartate aminotransferase family protein n=1 Tax=Neobacillus sp. DY30 TaxID=3047871 RepID=UPI0024C0D576|nr:aspartate aminotransferase family protein [Neobacillus sp. DY30]WHX99548.1 aspartate aminotransferase family protein [Neobacillus sp. DY30]
MLTNEFYLSSQNQRESNARSYPRRIPIAISEAEGIYVKDVENKTYIDCLAGAGTLALGHNHPVVIEAMENVIRGKRPLHTLDLTTPMKEEFVEELFDALPASFAENAKIQFCGPSGSDAIEAAMKLVKTATGRGGMLSFQGGYHGMTNGSLSLMGNLGPKTKIPNLMSDVHFLPYPYAYRCPFGIGGKEGAAVGSTFIERTLNDPESGIVKPAGMVMEVVQGEGGAIPAPDEWVKQVRRITSEQQIPLIVDEVQTGFGRTGKMFAFEHAGIIPDAVVLSKAIGGTLPLAVVVYHKELDQWGPGAHAGTFRGNQLAMAAGTATMKFIKREKLDEQAALLGDFLMLRLKEMKQDVQSIGDVRGLGLMVGAEIVDKTAPADALGSYPANPQLAKKIQLECFKRGLILELGGRYGSTVRFLPPLIITKEQLETVCDLFFEAAMAAEKALMPSFV